MITNSGPPRVRGRRSNAALFRVSLSFVLLCLAMFPSLTGAALFSPKTKVKQLTGNNFKSEVLDIEKPTMVAFTAPWCGHCQRLVPEFEKAAKQLDGIVKLANIDCDEDKNKPLCGSYGIQGFPTLKFFPPTKRRLPRDYQGGRTAKDIASYMVDALPLGVKKLAAEELKKYVESKPEKPKLVLFSTKPTSSPLYKSLALDFRSSISFSFLRGTQAAARANSRSHLGIPIDEKELPVLILVPSRSEDTPITELKNIKYEGELKYHDLYKWIIENVPEAKAKTSSGASAAAKSKTKPKPKPKANTKPQPKPKTKSAEKKAAEEDEEKLPSGAQVEWRAENVADSKERKEKLHDIADMLNKAAQKTRDEAAKKAAEAAESVGNLYEGVKQAVFDSASVDNRDAVPAQADKEGDIVDSETKSSSWSSSSSYSSSTDQDGNTVEDSDASYASSSSDDPEGGHSYRVASHRESGGAKRENLKESLQRWLDGESVDWEKKYGTDFARASEAAQALLRDDPETAHRIAAEGETYLLTHLRSDLEMMERAREAGNDSPSLADDKVKRVARMIAELETRIKEREAAPPRHEEL